MYHREGSMIPFELGRVLKGCMHSPDALLSDHRIFGVYLRQPKCRLGGGTSHPHTDTHTRRETGSNSFHTFLVRISHVYHWTNSKQMDLICSLAP